MSKEILRPQKAQPAPVQQEPVAWMDADGNVSDNNDHKCFPIPLYTTSNIQSYLEKDNSQRLWVGLTEERIKEIWLQGKDHGDDWADVLALARAFEAEIKELNHD